MKPVLALLLLVAAQPKFSTGALLYQDDFSHGLERWAAELEKHGRVEAKDHKLTIDIPAGLTLWFKPRLDGPVMIQYEAKMIQASGANDRVSDLNCFWMASDSRSPGDLFATKRSGKFSDYDQLLTYYVGLGGNSNTTTRFRRYIGKQELRPLLPEHDLHDSKFLLRPNVGQKIQLVACGNHIQYYRDGNLLFDLNDPSPYTRGHFAFRTTSSHMEVRNFRVYRITNCSD